MMLTSLSLFDHLLALIIIAILPIAGWLNMRAIRRRLAAGGTYTTRIADYRKNILVLWSIVGLLAMIWLFEDRSWAGIGLQWPTATPQAFFMAVLLTLGLVGFSYVTEKRVRSSRKAADSILEAMRRFEFALPKNRHELRWFYGVSITAGITEELLYRGFLIAYFASLVSLPLALIAAITAFAFAHSYQGLAGAAQTFVVGAILAAIYLLSGSLLLAVLAHVLVDVFGGRAVYAANDRVLSGPIGQDA